MQELIKISVNRIGEESINSVSARELHEILGVKKDFSSWIKAQLKRGMFEENIDFIVFTQKGENLKGGRPSIDYILTLDTAKEIAMMSGTAKGKEVRNYFIAVEKEYRLQNSEPAIKKRDDLISVSTEELDRELKALDFILSRMNFSEKDKIDFVNQTLERINFPLLNNPHLRKLQPVFTVTELLKDFRVEIRPADFNKKLESFGVIQRTENGNWELIDMRFGENRKFGNTLSPRYYRGEFQKLLETVL